MSAWQYPYLVGNLIAFPLLAAAYLAAGPQRPAMVASGLLLAPWGALSLILGDYWSPARIGERPLGIEDFLFSFQAGASTWFWGSLPFRRRLAVDLRVRPMLARAAIVTAAFVAGMGAMWAAGFSGPAPIFAALGVAVAVMLVRRPMLWRLAVAASVGFAATYVVLLAGLLALIPHLAAEWPGGRAWTVPVLGLPVGELVWALVGAPAHVLCFAYATRAELAGPASEAKRVAGASVAHDH